MESDIKNSNNSNLVGATATHVTTGSATTSFINAFATGYEVGYKAGCAVAAGCNVDDINDNICTGIGNIRSLVVKRDHHDFSTGFNAGYSDTKTDTCSTAADTNNAYNSDAKGDCLCWNLCCIL